MLDPLLMMSVGPLDTTTGPPKSEGRNAAECMRMDMGQCVEVKHALPNDTWYKTTMPRAMEFMLLRLEVPTSGLLSLSDPMSRR